MDSERVLVTGAGGFLGAHIIDHFSALGHRVAGVGRLASSTSSASSGNPADGRISSRMSLPDPAFIDVIRAFRPTLLVDCASTASVAWSVEQPYQDFCRAVDVCAFNLEATRLAAPRCRFVMLSSASVYGNPQALPISENAPLQPVSPYGYHKRLCEMLAEEYATLHGLKVVVLRIFSAYGEGLRRQVVHDICSRFADPALSHVELSGTGRESRDFIHARDVARIIEVIHRADARGVFNAAMGVQTTIAEVAEHIGRHFEQRKQVVFNGVARPGDPINWQACTARIGELGYCGSVELSSGLARYVKWFKAVSGGGV